MLCYVILPYTISYSIVSNHLEIYYTYSSKLYYVLLYSAFKDYTMRSDGIVYCEYTVLYYTTLNCSKLRIVLRYCSYITYIA